MRRVVPSPNCDANLAEVVTTRPIAAEKTSRAAERLLGVVSGGHESCVLSPFSLPAPRRIMQHQMGAGVDRGCAGLCWRGVLRPLLSGADGFLRTLLMPGPAAIQAVR